jgi:hypothetical protein
LLLLAAPMAAVRCRVPASRRWLQQMELLEGRVVRQDGRWREYSPSRAEIKENCAAQRETGIPAPVRRTGR